jgi:hypothetical protein
MAYMMTTALDPQDLPSVVVVDEIILSLAIKHNETIEWCDICEDWITYDDLGYPFCLCA